VMPPVPPPPVVQAAPDPAEPQPVDWRSIPPDEIMVMRLADGHEVLIRLAARMVPRHIENIRRLIAARWWDGLSIYRVQENWVAQWGDRTEKRPLPPGTAARVAPEFELATPPAVTPMVRPDAYSTWSGVTADGWPVAGDGRAAWLVHCYGSVGVARDDAPDSGSGAELFTPIGGGGHGGWIATTRSSAGWWRGCSIYPPCREATRRTASTRTSAGTRASPGSGWRATCPPPIARG